MISNESLIKRFISGETSIYNGSMCISGNTLYSYRTAIAKRVEGGVILNVTKYSPTTSRQQSLLKKVIYTYGTNVVKEVDNVEINTSCL